MVWLTRIGVHSSYAADLLPPLLVVGVLAGHDDRAVDQHRDVRRPGPADAGVASASVNTGQQLGGSIGTSLLNTVADQRDRGLPDRASQRGHPAGGKPTR